jgi:Enoyl-(Acyl carrier protein) reductase
LRALPGRDQGRSTQPQRVLLRDVTGAILSVRDTPAADPSDSPHCADVHAHADGRAAGRRVAQRRPPCPVPTRPGPVYRGRPRRASVRNRARLGDDHERRARRTRDRPRGPRARRRDRRSVRVGRRASIRQRPCRRGGGGDRRARVGRPDDIKALALFLASSASEYITGQEIVIDGGWGLGVAG